MNTQNLSYLQRNLLNLGFGEKLNDDLEKNIKAKKLEFTLNTTQEYNKDKVNYALHFKRGDENEMYFFNKYDAKPQDKDLQQTFFLNKGYGMTAKEAYNLLDGRAVHKQLTNLENEQYSAWVVLDKENKNDYGNHKLKTFGDGWNYKPERAIDKLDIVGINEPGEKDKLLKSLEKGNRHQVTVNQDGREVKIALEANPADHRVKIYNAKGIQQKLEDYKKPELKKETSQKQSQQSKEELPGKKSRKQGAKLKV